MVSPLQEYENNNCERWKVMQDIPPWITEPLVRVLGATFFQIANDDAVETIQRRMRIVLSEVCPFNYNSESGFEASLRGDITNGPGHKALLLLDITAKYIRDYAPHKVEMYSAEWWHDYEILDQIDNLLNDGSKWKVLRTENSDSGLIERVNPEITETAKRINDDYLTKAWNKAFQQHPDPEGAVESAQKAIETIASKRGLTTATSKVYGTVLGDIKANPDRYFSQASDAYNLHDRLIKKHQDVNAQFAQWFSAGMDFIQKTNPGRHSSNATDGFNLSAEAAQQAVVIATMIAWLIDSGSFKRVQKIKQY